MNSIRKKETFSENISFNSKEKVKNHKMSKQDFMIENILMQNTVENK